MTGGGNTAQGVYAPLPQTISDTESEEDLHTIIQTTKLPTYNHQSNNLLINGSGNKGPATMRNYRELDETDDHNVNNIPNITIRDNVPIIKKSDERMSRLRMFCFVLSISLCFIVIIVFLAVLPCNEDLTCPAVLREEYTSNWEKTYHGIELKSGISVVSGVTGRSRNLVFLFRGDIMNLDPVQEFPYISPDGGGLIAIVGSSGKVAWYIRLNRVPSDIDCNIIDVDRNGDNDCLVIGENGLMEAINPVLGTVLWHIRSLNNSQLKFTSVDFPIVVPDLDNDGIFDLVTSCSLNNKHQNNLILISGKTGSLIGDPLQVDECQTIHEVTIDKDNLISYNCQNITFKELDINLQDLYRKITNKRTNLINKPKPPKQHLNFSQKTVTRSQRNVYTIHNRKLIVQNDGKCPLNCNVTVQLIDLQSGRENLTWSHTGTNMYGMIPAILVFNDTDANRQALKGHLSGFILKFWQWNVPNKYKNEKLSVANHSRKVNKNFLDGWVTKRNSWSSDIRYRRNIPNLKTNKKPDNVSIQLLTERVVLITFNSTDLHIVNASQNEITQLCTNIYGGGQYVDCQPDLKYQENSVLISDLDKDGSQELISYLSTYVSVDDYNAETENSWQLQSIVKVVRLEAELPKLYEAVSKY